MRARVEQDHTERTISIEVLDGPVIDVTKSWNVKVRKIQVDQLTIRVVNGETVSLTANGGMVRVDGTVSHLQRGQTIWRVSRAGDDISTSPEWARLIWREAPAGVITWRGLIEKAA